MSTTSLDDLNKAIELVLEWHDENFSDGVQREFAIDELRRAYENIQASHEEEDDNCPACRGDKGAFVDGHWNDCIVCRATGKR